MWGFCFVGLLAPRPRQHRMLHPKLRLTAQEKSNRKRKHSNAFSSATPVFLFKIVSALREAHSGSGPATAGAWGRHQPLHESILTLLSKNHIRWILCPQGHHLGLNALRLRGGAGAACVPADACVKAVFGRRASPQWRHFLQRCVGVSAVISEADVHRWRHFLQRWGREIFKVVEGGFECGRS